MVSAAPRWVASQSLSGGHGDCTKSRHAAMHQAFVFRLAVVVLQGWPAPSRTLGFGCWPPRAFFAQEFEAMGFASLRHERSGGEGDIY